MYSEGIPGGQLAAWVFVAVVPTAIQLTAGASWLSVLLTVLICLFCTCLVWRWGITPTTKSYAAAMWMLMAILLGVLSQEAIKCWSQGGHVAVPLILLVLALWSAWKGPAAAAGIGCVLFWLFLILYLVLFAGGLNEIQLRWLKPTQTNVEGLGCVLLLVPAAAAIHLNKRECIKSRVFLIGLFCVLGSIITVGVLSPQVAANKEYAFYEMARSLTLLGQARRFEAVLSAGTTIGWFTMMCLCLTICGKVAENISSGWGGKGMVLAAALAAVCVLLRLQIPGVILLLFAGLLWVLIPISAQGMRGIKKS